MVNVDVPCVPIKRVIIKDDKTVEKRTQRNGITIGGEMNKMIDPSIGIDRNRKEIVLEDETIV